MKLDLDFYGNVLHKMNYEEIGYYLTRYESETHFIDDPELQTAFTEARAAINRFVGLVEQRIENAGGNPEDYE